MLKVRRMSHATRGDVRGSSSDFRKFWAALTISLFGSDVTHLAIPIIAATALDATPFQMGLLLFARSCSFLLFSLPAGDLIDRIHRLPVLIATDIISALLLCTIPLSMLVDGPYYYQLVLVVFGIGACAVIRQVSHFAYIPTLVDKDDLVRCNSRLQISYSASDTAGPGVGGALIQIATAPIAILADVASFVVSALLFRSIEHPEPPIATQPEMPLRYRISEGMRLILRDVLLRPIVLSGVLIAFFGSATSAIYILYLVDRIGLSPLTIGLIFVAGGLGAFPGAIFAQKVALRFGIGRATIIGWFLAGVFQLLVPLAFGHLAIVITMLAAAQILGALVASQASIHQSSIRQAVTPNRLAGRVTAGTRFLWSIGGALGALMGGVLGSTVGLRSSLLVFSIAAVFIPVYALFTPLRLLRELPE